MRRPLAVRTVASWTPACSRKRGVDLDVKPRLDRAGDKLHRHRVDDQTGHYREQRKAHQQPQSEAGSEYASPIAPRERQQLKRHYPGEQRGERRVECKQQRILLGEKRSVRARGGKQEQAHGCHRTAEDEKQLHLSLAPRGSRLSTGAGSCWGERTVNRFHGDSRCSSRLVSALS